MAIEVRGSPPRHPVWAEPVEAQRSRSASRLCSKAPSGFRPDSRPTFFASPKKVGKERRPDGGGPAPGGRTALRCSGSTATRRTRFVRCAHCAQRAARVSFTMALRARCEPLRSSTPPTGPEHQPRLAAHRLEVFGSAIARTPSALTRTWHALPCPAGRCSQLLAAWTLRPSVAGSVKASRERAERLDAGNRSELIHTDLIPRGPDRSRWRSRALRADAQRGEAGVRAPWVASRSAGVRSGRAAPS